MHYQTTTYLCVSALRPALVARASVQVLSRSSQGPLSALALASVTATATELQLLPTSSSPSTSLATQLDWKVAQADHRRRGINGRVLHTHTANIVRRASTFFNRPSQIARPISNDHYHRQRHHHRMLTPLLTPLAASLAQSL